MEHWQVAVIVGAALAIALLAVVRTAGRRAHRARLAQEPAAPPTPVPVARLQRSASDQGLAAVRAPAVDGRIVVLAAEIEHADDGFRLRSLGDEADILPLEAPTPMPIDADAVATRNAVASRAHALLCDRLAQHGWEPCGRGAQWYAHRYRRTVLTPT